MQTTEMVEMMMHTKVKGTMVVAMLWTWTTGDMQQRQHPITMKRRL
jgi:hypothetical protein